MSNSAMRSNAKLFKNSLITFVTRSNYICIYTCKPNFIQINFTMFNFSDSKNNTCIMYYKSGINDRLTEVIVLNIYPEVMKTI